MKDKIVNAEQIENKLQQRDFLNEILLVIKNSKTADDLRDGLADYHDNDIATVFSILSQEERKKIYSALTNEELSEIFSYLEDPEPFIEEISSDKAADIVESMAADDAVDLLEELDEDKKQEIIDLMDKQSVNDVKLIYKYDEDSVGAMMTTDFVSIDQSFTVKQAMKQIIAQAAETDNILTVFVTENKIYKGAFKLKDLVIARSSTPLNDIIVTSFPYLYAEDKISDVLERVKAYSEDCLPVLNSDNQLIGALTSTDIVEAVDDEMRDDYAKLAGLTEETKDDEPIKKSIVSRLPWLAVLLILDLIIGAYSGIFEAIVIGLPFLVCFQQMISGMGGNVGTQSLAISVRVLSQGDLSRNRLNRLVVKETLVGFFNGLITGILSAIAVFVYCMITNATGKTTDFCVLTGVAVGVSMLTATVISSLTGTVIPIILSKLKADPAVASGPLITTVNDLIAITVYYGFAFLLMGSIV